MKIYPVLLVLLCGCQIQPFKIINEKLDLFPDAVSGNVKVEPPPLPPRHVFVETAALTSMAVPAPISRYKTIYFQYDPKVNRAAYLWYIDRSMDLETWHPLYVTPDMFDSEGFVTINETKSFLFYRARGVPKT